MKVLFGALIAVVLLIYGYFSVKSEVQRKIQKIEAAFHDRQALTPEDAAMNAAKSRRGHRSAPTARNRTY
jgi:hypothetical protein